MAAFAEWVAQLPQQVREHLCTAELDSAALVVDSVSPQFLAGEGGATITKTVDVAFLESIAAACDQVKPGTGAYAKVRQFYEKCYKLCCKDASAGSTPEATPLEARDATAEEYYELSPDYRKQRLQALNTARRCEVDAGRLPSLRMWGRWERLHRVNKEFETVAATKIQSDAAACARPAAAELKPGVGGVLAWRLPAIAEAPAGGLVELEEACYLIENLLFLCGWVQDIECLATFHERFWGRVRRSKQPMPGCRPMSLTEVQHALCLFQSQWAKASRSADKLDNAIFRSLPADADELDGRLALAPRQAGQQASGFTNAAAAPNDGTGESQSKRARLSRGERRERSAAAASYPSAPAQPPKGKGKGKGKGKPAPTTENARRAPKGDLCWNFSNGKTCKHGDACWFRHA